MTTVESAKKTNRRGAENKNPREKLCVLRASAVKKAFFRRGEFGKLEIENRGASNLQ
jgi:hypothetical protein